VLSMIPSGAAPTVFELLLQDQLLSGFRPAFNHALDTGIPALFPRLVRLLEHKDELWTLIHLLVEKRYLSSARSYWHCSVGPGSTVTTPCACVQARR